MDQLRKCRFLRHFFKPEKKESDSHTLPFSQRVPEQVDYAVREYHQRSKETSTLLHQLFEGYEKEGLAMPYTMADFRREYVKEHLKDLTPEEVLEGMPAEKILKALPAEERLKGLSAEEIERYLRRLKGKTPFGDTSSSPE